MRGDSNYKMCKTFVKKQKLLKVQTNHKSSEPLPDNMGRRITQVRKNLLYQRLSVLMQCYKAVAIVGTFAHTTPEDEF